VIQIVLLENRFGLRPPDFASPEIAPGWSCTGCGSTVRARNEAISLPMRSIERALSRSC